MESCSRTIVVVANISAMCKNAIHCGDHCCSVELVGESTWQVKVRSDGQNMSKVGSIDVTVDVDGSTAPSLSTTAPCPGCYTINIPDADIFKNKGKPYLFYAKLNATDPEYAASLSEPEACGSITPSGITCTPKTIADINSGDSWPLFEVSLNHCPSSDCKYNVTMGKGSLTEYTVATGVEQPSGNHQYRYEGEPIECNDDGGCVYTYLLESTESDKPFSCSQSFTVRKKDAPVELSLDCSLSDQTGVPVNTPMTTSGTVTATGCESGCTWTITDNGTEVGNGTYGSTPYTFTGETSAGTHSYVFNVKRTSDNAEQSCTAFSVEYVEESSSSAAQSSSSAGGCECTCSDCGAIVVGTNVGVSQNSNGSVVCAFGKTVTNVNTNGRTVIINGSEVSSYCLNWTGGDNPCATVYSGITKKDGGYYMEIPAGGWINATVSGATSNPCAGGGSGVSSSSVAPASSAGGGGGATPVTISYQDYKSFTPGKTYTLTFSGSSGSVFRCTYTDRSYSFKMGVYGGADWNVGANTGGQATQSNPGDGAVKTFVVDSSAPSDLQCATDW